VRRGSGSTSKRDGSGDVGNRRLRSRHGGYSYNRGADGGLEDVGCDCVITDDVGKLGLDVEAATQIQKCVETLVMVAVPTIESVRLAMLPNRRSAKIILFRKKRT